MRQQFLLATAAAVVVVGGTAAGLALGDGGPTARAAQTATMGTAAATVGHATGDAARGTAADATSGAAGADATQAAAVGPRDDRADHGRAGEQPRTTVERAVRLAVQVRPGQVTEVERDRERGRAVWEVEVRAADGTEHEVAVDTSTGRVLAAHPDDRDDRDDDRGDRDDDRNDRDDGRNDRDDGDRDTDDRATDDRDTDDRNAH